MKTTINFFLFSIFSNLIFGGDYTPKNQSGKTAAANSLRVHYKSKKNLFYLSSYLQTSLYNQKEKDFSIGYRYRPLKNLKLGAYYSLRSGLRHDEDWILNERGWVWKDTNKRRESFLGLEISPRFLLRFIPGTWVFESRLKLEKNFHNSNNTLKFRPSLTYIYLNNSGALFNLSYRHEFYIPLNYGREFVYENWNYFNFLYHFSEKIKPGLFFTSFKKKWSYTDSFYSNTSQKYTNYHQGKILGLSILFKI